MTSIFERIPQDRNQRWELLREFIATWYRPVAPGDGFDSSDFEHTERRLGLALPPAFREWLGIAGKRKDVWCRQDEILSPEELVVADNVLVFYVENQAVVRWGIHVADLSLEDPPVVVEDVNRRGKWIMENQSTSEFALEMLVFAVKWSNRNCGWASGIGNGQVTNRVEESYPRLAFPGWHWPVWPTQFYGRQDIIVEIDGPPDDAWLYVSARTEQAFRDCEKLLTGTGVQWEASSDEWPPGWVSSGLRNPRHP